MKIVFISYLGIGERFLIETIAARYAKTVVVQPIRSATAHEFRVLLPPRYGLNVIVKALGRIGTLYNGNRLATRLYRDGRQSESLEVVTIQEGDINRRPGFTLLEDLEPDVLITCGSPVLRGELIRIPRKAAFNIHYGVAPEYRGNDTLFWPMLYGDFERVGGSIHHLSERVDRGNLLAIIRPKLRPRDGLLNVEHKLTLLFSEVVLELLDSVYGADAVPRGLPQGEGGRSFRKRERTPLKRLEYHTRRMLGLLKLPRREQEITRYFEITSASPRAKEKAE